MSETIPSARSQFMGRGIETIRERPEFNRLMYWIFSSLGKFQKEVQDTQNVEEAIGLFMDFIRDSGFFHESAVYLVNEEAEFKLHQCSQQEMEPQIESFVQNLIKSRQFGWALRENREVLVESPETLPGQKGVLHALSTRQSTFGMFVGLIRKDLAMEFPTISRMLSLIIDLTVYVIENRNLEQELTEHNHKLENTVSSRTRELVSSNQHLHQSNVRLKRLNEKKSEFLGIVAHDLKNPLSGILGLSQLLEMSVAQSRENEDRLNDSESTLKMLRQIIDSTGEMVNALNQLMNSETIESGKIQLEPCVTDLGHVVRKVVALNNSQANAKEIQIHTEYEEQTDLIGDPLRLQEAIDNLLSNAIKYSPLQSVVRVKTCKKPPLGTEDYRVSFSVKDQGPGLSEEDKEKLFGRFQKLSARPTAGESSTGLGLFIFKRLIDLHNGKVWVVSELGMGSEFGFDIPVNMP